MVSCKQESVKEIQLDKILWVFKNKTKSPNSSQNQIKF